MAKQIRKNVWSVSIERESPSLRSYRLNLQVHAKELSIQVSRLAGIARENNEKKLALRDNARAIESLSNASVIDLISSKPDFFRSLDYLESEAIRTAEITAGASFIRSPARAQLSTDTIVKFIRDIRNTFALIEHEHNSTNQDNNLLLDIPAQQPAPIKVDISDFHLNLVSSRTQDGTLTYRSTENLRSAVCELLDRTIDQIGSQSNIDPRLAPNLRGLKSYLAISMDSMPIEAMGLNYQFARRSFGATRDTVPDLIAEQIDQILSTVNVILNQYEEWRQYLSAETALNLPISSMQNIVEASQKVEEFFDNNDELVEQKLINRLREITDAYSQGLINIESAAVPLIESLGNIFSELSRFVISNSPVALDSVGTSGTAILFLGFAIKSIETFTPTLSEFPPLSFLIDVQKFAHKQFSFLKDSLPS